MFACHLFSVKRCTSELCPLKHITVIIHEQYCCPSQNDSFLLRNVQMYAILSETLYIYLP